LTADIDGCASGGIHDRQQQDCTVLPVIYDALKQKPGVLSATSEIEYSTYDERPTTPIHQNKIPDKIYDSENKIFGSFSLYIIY
jgi:hypothetical protein